MEIIAINYGPISQIPIKTMVMVSGNCYSVLNSVFTPEVILGLPDSEVQTNPSAFIFVPTS